MLPQAVAVKLRRDWECAERSSRPPGTGVVSSNAVMAGSPFLTRVMLISAAGLGKLALSDQTLGLEHVHFGLREERSDRPLRGVPAAPFEKNQWNANEVVVRPAPANTGHWIRRRPIREVPLAVPTSRPVR